MPLAIVKASITCLKRCQPPTLCGWIVDRCHHSNGWRGAGWWMPARFQRHQAVQWRPPPTSALLREYTLMLVMPLVKGKEKPRNESSVMQSACMVQCNPLMCNAKARKDSSSMQSAIRKYDAEYKEYMLNVMQIEGKLHIELSAMQRRSKGAGQGVAAAVLLNSAGLLQPYLFVCMEPAWICSSLACYFTWA
eukprot:scaffold67829_cov19-Tisochrysis_lutea.AAC.1